MSAEKKKFPRAEAIAVARQLVEELKPVCAKLIVAGSLRRRKILVGDVEIIYIGRTEERMVDMFDTAMVNLAEERIEALLARTVLDKRPNTLGAFSWGAKNKLAVHLASGIPVDLFAATEANWFNYLVCRTGPAASNTRIAQAAIDKGWKWNPYGSGFTRGGPLAGEPQSYQVCSEEDVFQFVGLPYKEPWER